MNILETIEDSWYEEDIHVGYTNAVLQPTFAAHHAAEVHSILIPKLSTRAFSW